MDKHHRRDIVQPGNFVSFAGTVCKELDMHWRAFLSGTGPRVVSVDLTDRIGSTGIEAKVYNAKTGNAFNIDMGAMVQINATSGFARKIFRRELKKPPAVKKAERAVQKRANNGGAELTMPTDVQGDMLIMFAGQLLQTSQTREDGWAYGNVMYDPVPDRMNVSGQGASTMAGWFHMSRTDMPTTKQMTELAKQIGGDGGSGGVDALQAPSTWQKVEESASSVQLVALRDGAEKQEVIGAMLKTIDQSAIKIEKVERVENLPLWQTYVVKRQTMVSRDKEEDTSDYERRWLFHGTDDETVRKICQMGFNRSFAGKNATKYGKGVYLAKTAFYSQNYAKPSAKGKSHMLLVRAAVGKYALGTDSMVAPPPRTDREHQLHDSTVNHVSKPTIFVTYHDAQAYPEYLVTFSETN